MKMLEWRVRRSSTRVLCSRPRTRDATSNHYNRSPDI